MLGGFHDVWGPLVLVVFHPALTEELSVEYRMRHFQKQVNGNLAAWIVIWGNPDSRECNIPGQVISPADKFDTIDTIPPSCVVCVHGA